MLNAEGSGGRLDGAGGTSYTVIVVFLMIDSHSQPHLDAQTESTIQSVLSSIHASHLANPQRESNTDHHHRIEHDHHLQRQRSAGVCPTREQDPAGTERAYMLSGVQP